MVLDERVKSAQIAEVAVHSMFIWEKISFFKFFVKWKDGEMRFFCYSGRYGSPLREDDGDDEKK